MQIGWGLVGGGLTVALWADGRVGRRVFVCAEEGDLTPAEISALSRAGYGRTDGDGRFFADEEKMSGVGAKAPAPKPNNVSVRGSTTLTPVHSPRV
eukprot:COSAG02_NODE_3317_length_6950_cov_2.669683_4_plen_96_part_00